MQQLSLPGYAHVQHVHSAATHETLVAESDVTKELVHIRVYALEYLRKHPQLRMRVERRALVARIADHPNIVKGLPSFVSGVDLFLVEEHCVGGELLCALEEYYRSAVVSPSTQEIRSRPGQQVFQCLSLSFVRCTMQDLMRGVHYLHSTCGVVHRNVKLENIFLDGSNRAKLGGLDMCAVIPSCEANDGMLQLCCASRHYAAPELVMGQPYKGELIDVWSAGVVLFVLLTGRFPFQVEEEEEEGGGESLLFQRICTADEVLQSHPAMGVVPDPLAVDLVRNMLRVKPECRLTVEEVLQHSFLRTP
ncbi:serine/threonine protein kinase [Trypanosoma rangeli]|uniref:Serine/threonine protein kinase n=1 Tax=Trypanosoma rangeli TaxID=5698 RepID=A0A3R7MGA2_TRYRA|nr:serine/threonine protein kinase [Trypanosoma rangeli]RNF05311.1 serine/threonine protein kinase [Trypanosoma rangeli]|eukprot:RNF05311.1 serine/threonine protein kinase [Trypanosoma rangeli]